VSFIVVSSRETAIVLPKELPPNHAILREIFQDRFSSWHAGRLCIGNLLTGMALADMLMRVFLA